MRLTPDKQREVLQSSARFARVFDDSRRVCLSREPLVAAAWIGLAVKTDGAAVAGGGITEALVLAKAAAKGVQY